MTQQDNWQPEFDPLGPASGPTGAAAERDQQESRCLEEGRGQPHRFPATRNRLAVQGQGMEDQEPGAIPGHRLIPYFVVDARCRRHRHDHCLDQRCHRIPGAPPGRRRARATLALINERYSSRFRRSRTTGFDRCRDTISTTSPPPGQPWLAVPGTKCFQPTTGGKRPPIKFDPVGPTPAAQ